MLDFICVLLIFFEIIFTLFCVKKLVYFENQVNEFHIKMLEQSKVVFIALDEFKNLVSKINKVIRIITNKKIYQIKRIVMMIVDIVQTIVLIKSLNLTKGIKSINLKVVKNVAFIKIVQQLIRKGLDFFQNLCAI